MMNKKICINLMEIDVSSIKPLVKYKSYKDINTEQTLAEYKRHRRICRDKLIAEILKTDTFNINEQRHEVNVSKQTRYYSASYSEFEILVGIHNTPIGVDLERYTNLTEEKGNLIINDTNKSIINECFIGHTAIECITMMWCFRESVGKLLGIGISEGIQAFHFVRDRKNAKFEVNVYYQFMEECCMAICY